MVKTVLPVMDYMPVLNVLTDTWLELENVLLMNTMLDVKYMVTFSVMFVKLDML